MTKEKPSIDIVYDAVLDLHNDGQIVTREALLRLTNLAKSIIDDRIKELIDQERVIRVERGVYIPAHTHPPSRVISITMLPDGIVILDIGDDVLRLTPKEARTLALLLNGLSLTQTHLEKSLLMLAENNHLTCHLKKLQQKTTPTL